MHILLYIYVDDGSDYIGGSFQVEFPAGSTTASLTVDILDDNLLELDEWFGGLLSVSGVEGVTNATPGTPLPFSYSPKYRIGSKDMATIKINDTDCELKI